MYQPRTQSRKFRNEDCPADVLAIYDNGGKSFDRYTVFFKPVEPLKDLRGWIGYRGMSEDPFAPQGFGIYDEMEAYKVAQYRTSVYRESCKWSDLPEQVKKSVRQDCAEIAKARKQK